MVSDVCSQSQKVLHDFNALPICLKIGRSGEASRKQGEFRDAGVFSTELSTFSVDRFPLAPGPV
jgi:hypothetical protein